MYSDPLDPAHTPSSSQQPGSAQQPAKIQQPGQLTPISLTFDQVITERVRNAMEQEPFQPQDLIDALKLVPALAHLYAQDARVMENYTIEEHTLMVLNQANKHLGDIQFPPQLPRSAFFLTMALHDIGKPLPAKKEDQHEETIKVIKSVEHLLPVDAALLNIAKALIDGEPIGEYIKSFLKNAPKGYRQQMMAVADTRPLTIDDLNDFAAQVVVSLDETQARQICAATAQDLKTRTAGLGITPSEFLKLQILFYQSDTSAYTYEATTPDNRRRAYPGLDILYELSQSFSLPQQSKLLVRDTSQGMLRFTPPVRRMLEILIEETAKV